MVTDCEPQCVFGCETIKLGQHQSFRNVAKLDQCAGQQLCHIQFGSDLFRRF